MWIFWHDWWPWYVAGWAAFTAAVGVLLGVLKRRDRSTTKPCIPITCPPADIRCECCGGLDDDWQWCSDSEDEQVVVALCAACRTMLSVEER